MSIQISPRLAKKFLGIAAVDLAHLFSAESEQEESQVIELVESLSCLSKIAYAPLIVAEVPPVYVPAVQPTAQNPTDCDESNPVARPRSVGRYFLVDAEKACRVITQRKNDGTSYDNISRVLQITVPQAKSVWRFAAETCKSLGIDPTKAYVEDIRQIIRRLEKDSKNRVCIPDYREVAA